MQEHRKRMALLAGALSLVLVAILFHFFSPSREGVSGRQAYARQQYALEGSKEASSKEFNSPSMTGGGFGGGAPASEMRMQSPGMRYANVPGQGAARDEPSSVGASIVPASYDIRRMTASQVDRYLVKNATMQLEVKSAREASRELNKRVKALRGYVAGGNEQADYLGVRSIQVQVRVPFTAYEEMVDFLEGLGDVKVKTAQSEDVTEEYVDSAARAKNLKNTESRLSAHLARTTTLANTLTIEREITRVRQEIEQLEGRLRYLADRVSFSTIDITLSEAPRAVAIKTEQTFSSGQTFSDAGRSLLGFLQGVWSVAIWLGVWAIVWFPFTAIAFVLVRRWWRRYMGSVPAGAT